MAEDRMLSDEVLLALIKKNSGGGGTSDYSRLTNKPEINGVTLSGDKSASDLSLASLDSNGKVPAAQLPSYVDDVINGYLYEGHFYEDSAHTTEITGESGKIYVDLESNKTYRWSGLAFVEISESLALGETASTAYAGDKGKANADAITAIKDGQSIDSFSDVETALSGKQSSLTAGNNIKMENDAISVNRWFIPAGKVVYTIITSDENYGQNVHIQRHTLGGAFIDDRTFLCEMYKTVTIDDLISIWNPYSEYRITLLEDSDEHTKGYSYTVNPISAATSTSFTFVMPQEENDNDLIIREELDAVSSAVSAIKDGQSIDSFSDVETALASKQATLTFDSAPTDGSTNPVESNGVYDALALKQNATDNNLQTTDKTVVGAVNELKSGLTNYENQNNLNLEVPNRKNLLNYDAWKNVAVSHGSAIWENNGVTLTASENDCFTRFEPSYYPNDAKIYVKEGETITLSWEETTNKSGIVMIFPNGNIVGDAYVNNSDAKTVSYIVGSGITFVTFRFGVANSGETISYKNIQIELGSTATAYAPYIPSVESRIEAVESGKVNLRLYYAAAEVTSYSIPVTRASTYIIALNIPNGANSAKPGLYYVVKQGSSVNKFDLITDVLGLTVTISDSNIVLAWTVQNPYGANITVIPVTEFT